MMEQNNDFFLAGGDALMYLTGPMHEKYCTAFGWRHPFSTYVPIFQLPSPCKDMYAFRVTVTAVGLFQKKILRTIAHM